MWLVAATTNNEPCVTAHHFVSFMQQIRGLLLLTRHIACTIIIMVWVNSSKIMITVLMKFPIAITVLRKKTIARVRT